MGRINIAFDIDGCIVDYVPTLDKVVWDMYKKERVGCIEDWEFESQYGITSKQLQDAFAETYCRHTEMELFPGAFEILHYLHEQTGDYITFVTARPVAFATETMMLMKRLCKHIPFTICYAHPGQQEKIDYLKHFEVFVEDNPDNVLSIVKAGLYVYMPYYEYNKHIATPTTPYYSRIHPIFHLHELKDDIFRRLALRHSINFMDIPTYDHSD